MAVKVVTALRGPYVAMMVDDPMVSGRKLVPEMVTKVPPVVEKNVGVMEIASGNSVGAGVGA